MFHNKLSYMHETKTNNITQSLHQQNHRFVVNSLIKMFVNTWLQGSFLAIVAITMVPGIYWKNILPRKTDKTRSIYRNIVLRKIHRNINE